MTDETLKVLIVDDEPAVVRALEILFDLHGIATRSAGTPETAVAALERGDVGVVIQDMNFGADKTSGEQGVRLFHRLRGVEAEIPVVLMTAWASLEAAVKLIKEGANDYLSKPWDDDKLVVTVQNLLRLRGLQLENEKLQRASREGRERLAREHDLCGVVYESEEMHRVVSMAVNVAGSDAPVLITGPSGAGKEKLAEIVHANSRRRERPFLRVNVGALPEELMESELFGAEAGAYTGSKGLRIGHFGSADGGTLFLDEIDALSLAGQIKLLRVVQSGEYQRLGSSKTRRADVRLISASNSDLKQAIASGSFREDLFYRLNVIELRVPALIDRPKDILPLARHFLGRARHGRHGETATLDAESEAALICHDWGGNVRELENRIQRAILTGTGPVVTAADLDLGGSDDADPKPLAALTGEDLEEKGRIEQMLLAVDGNVSRAAERLGVSRQALYRRMEKLGIVLERRPR